jgi:phage baseplate assembly protein W
MLSAELYLLQTVQTSANSTQVQLGVSIIENDTTLPSQYVSGTVNWGDGTAPYAIAPTAVQVTSPASVSVTYSSVTATLRLSPEPVIGTFSLIFGSAPITAIPYNVTTAQLLQLVTLAVGGLSNVSIIGTFPAWTFTFDTSDSAQLLVAGSDTLFAPAPLPIHTYPPGNFNVTLSATNYRAPVNDTTNSSLVLNLLSTAAAPPTPILIGPILPADQGSPNEDQWSLNTSTDIKVLASNVKMILLVEPGERLMMPTYGCTLREYVFDPLAGTTTQDINSSITQAITTWEPRVQIQSLSTIVNKPNRSVTINMMLGSKLNQQQFMLQLNAQR